MHLLYGFYAPLLKLLNNFLRAWPFFSKNGSLRDILGQEVRNGVRGKVEEIVKVVFQAQVGLRVTAICLCSGIDRKVEMHGLHDGGIQELQLAHEQVCEVYYEILLEVLVLGHQQPQLNIEIPFAYTGLYFVKIWMLLRSWWINFWQLLRPHYVSLLGSFCGRFGAAVFLGWVHALSCYKSSAETLG